MFQRDSFTHFRAKRKLSVVQFSKTDSCRLTAALAAPLSSRLFYYTPTLRVCQAFFSLFSKKVFYPRSSCSHSIAYLLGLVKPFLKFLEFFVILLFFGKPPATTSAYIKGTNFRKKRQNNSENLLKKCAGCAIINSYVYIARVIPLI